MIRRAGLAVLVLALSAHAAAAGAFSDPVAAGFQPRFPISSITGPASWFDPSRLHLSSTLTVGSGSGFGTNALQTTSLNYQFRAPLSLNVSLGNAFGAGNAGGSSFFLQSLDLNWQPTRNSLFRFQVANVRSPLQYGYGYGYGDATQRGFWGR